MTALEKYENSLASKGHAKLSREEARRVFDEKARKLVKMSGKEALKRIRSGKCGSNLAWSELTLFAAAMR